MALKRGTLDPLRSPWATKRSFLSSDHGLDGTKIWRFRPEHQVRSAPTVFRDSVYCGSVDGNLRSLEYRTGRQLWKFETLGPITGSAVVFDDIMYLESTDHHVYALLA